MLTVIRKKSLAEYRAARREAGSVVFRDSLTEVERWLRSLGKTELTDLLVDEILGMTKKNTDGVDGRLDARTALNHLRDERKLFCVE